MKIRSISTRNHEILGNIDLNFLDTGGRVCDTVIFAGENGCGKSSILNLIYEFSNFNVLNKENEIRVFEVEINLEEYDILKNEQNISSYFQEEFNKKNNILIFKWDTINNLINDWGNCVCEYLDNNGNKHVISGGFFLNGSIKKMFRGLFSDAEINFNSSRVASITSKTLDSEVVGSMKSTSKLATDIKQLLIDIQSLDDSQIGEWVRNNLGEPIPQGLVDVRTNRFRRAFDRMFPLKKYEGIKNINNEKQVIFEEKGKKMNLEQLSSGEKQIVFRGGFCLKDKKNIEGVLVMLDEPEISLHPEWQSKITSFYQEIFSSVGGEQTSQIFIATHSPFIIHNENRKNDKVIILKKLTTGEISVSDENSFYGYNEKTIVEEAFKLSLFSEKIKDVFENHIVITEGKTDWKHLKRAYTKLRDKGIQTNLIHFFEYEEDIEMGDKNLITLCEQISKISNDNKIICVFDRDVKTTLKKVGEQSYKEWGNNVFSLSLPLPEHRLKTPEISIEHYYTDDEIKTSDENGRRLYIGNEFSSKTGAHISEKKICIEKKKAGKESIKIIDNNVFEFSNEDINVALTKENFSKNILKENELFKHFGYLQFIPVFQMIDEILEK